MATNADKYLRKNVDIEDLTGKLIEYAYKEKEGNLFKITKGFFAQKAIPTLKDMEDPIFWNLEDNNHMIYIIGWVYDDFQEYGFDVMYLTKSLDKAKKQWKAFIKDGYRVANENHYEGIELRKYPMEKFINEKEYETIKM